MNEISSYYFSSSFSEDEQDSTNRSIMKTISIISLIGSLLVFFLSIVSGRIKRNCWKVVCFACISESCFTIMLLVGNANWEKLGVSTPLCNFEGFVLGVSSIITNSWLLYIALSLLVLVLNNNTADSSSSSSKLNRIIQSWKGELIWFIFWLLLASISSILPIAHVGGMSYSRVQSGWCHISPKPTFGRFINYSIQWIMILSIIIIYCCVFFAIRKQFPKQRERVMLPRKDIEMRIRIFTMFRQIVLYPIMLIISWIPTTIARIIGAILHGKDPEWASTLTAIVVPMLGILLFICFLLTSRVPFELFQRIRKFFLNQKSNIQQPLISSSYQS